MVLSTEVALQDRNFLDTGLVATAGEGGVEERPDDLERAVAGGHARPKREDVGVVVRAAEARRLQIHDGCGPHAAEMIAEGAWMEALVWFEDHLMDT